jgi:dTDP-4-amino-4,6-dideoxygalactose transaminase
MTSSRIPLARPSITDAEIAAAERALRSGRLVIGPENVRFERGLAGLTGRKDAVAVTSGTTALEIVLWACSIGPGDEVLVPAAGFPAAVNAILRVGAEPVAVDVTPTTWNMDVDAARDACTERTKALVSIDQLGLVADAVAIEALGAERSLVVIDDAACALGGTGPDGVRGGSYGRAGILSFHPRKLITTGEGGAVVCDDADLAETMRQLRNQGQAGRGVFARAGANARLSEISAAVGCAQIDRIDELLAERRLLVNAYDQRLETARLAGRLSWQEAPTATMHAHQTFAVMLAADCDRATVIARLEDQNIESGVATFSIDRLDAFRELPGVAARSYPVATALHDRGLALPLYPGMRSAELDRVCAALTEAIA